MTQFQSPELALISAEDRLGEALLCEVAAFNARAACTCVLDAADLDDDAEFMTYSRQEAARKAIAIARQIPFNLEVSF